MSAGSEHFKILKTYPKESVFRPSIKLKPLIIVYGVDKKLQIYIAVKTVKKKLKYIVKDDYPYLFGVFIQNTKYIS